MAHKEPKGTDMGRPTLLTPERQKKICDLLKSGNYIETACTLTGVSKQTHYNWINRAQEELNRLGNLDEEDPEPAPAEQIYVDYLDATTQARAEAESRNVMLIQQAASGVNVVKTRTTRDSKGNIVEEREEKYVERDWRAALEFLQRSFPERWKHRTAIEATGKDGGPISVAAEVHYHMPDNGRDPQVNRSNGKPAEEDEEQHARPPRQAR